MSTNQPALDAVTETDKSAFIIVSSYAWAFATLVTAIARLMLTAHRSVKIALDDITFFVATGFAVLTAVLYHITANAGLGQHESDLTDSQISDYFKRLYAAQLLGIVTIALGKLSAVLLNQRLDNRNPRNIYILMGAVGVWTVFSFFSQAFQCNPPDTWVFRPSNCPSRGYLQYVIIALNMVTDFMIVAFIVPPLYRLNMSKESRMTAIAVFGTRLIVPGIAIGSLATLPRVISSSDQTWANVPKTFFDQAVIHLSVIITTVPRVNRLITSLKDDLSVPLVSHREVETSNLARIESAAPGSARTGRSNSGGTDSAAAAKEMNSAHSASRPS